MKLQQTQVFFWFEISQRMEMGQQQLTFTNSAKFHPLPVLASLFNADSDIASVSIFSLTRFV